MEKKRRARINNCLTQLKSLVLQAMRKDTNQYSKLEKADILEMTVKHLRQLQRQHVSQAISCDPNVATKYKAGFNECANEVIRYLNSVPNVDGEVRKRLVNHLGNVVTSVNSTPEQQPCQPLNVQIPHQQMNHGLANNGSTNCLLMPAGAQTSQLVLQPVQNMQNVQAIYSQSQNTSVHHQQATSSASNNGSSTRVCGSFQIVPNNISPSAVALYLGHSQQGLPQSAYSTAQVYPSSSPSSSSQMQSQHAIPLYSSHTPPRTKASFKAFDSSAFSQVHSSDEARTPSPSCSSSASESSSSPSLQSYSPHLDFTMHGLAVQCGRTPSPLKVEDVWRPW